MRTLCITLGILFCAGVGLYIGATEFPQELESFITKANERSATSGGVTIPATPHTYQTASAVVLVAVPILFFLIILRLLKRKRELESRIRLEREQVRNAHAVLTSFGQGQEGLKVSARSAEPTPDLTAIVTEIEENARRAETAIGNAEGAHAAAQESFAARLQALREKFTAAQGRCTILEEGSNALSAAIDEVQTASSNVQEAITSLEEDTGSSTLAEIEEQVPDFEKRVAALEDVSPRVRALQTSLASLKGRMEKADGTEDDNLSDVLSACSDTKDEIEEALDEIEGDGNVENLDEWEGKLPDFEERIAALETINPRALALGAKLKEIDERLDKANGEKNSTLPELLESLGEKKGELEEALNEVENADPESTIDDLEGELAELRKRVERVERAKERTTAVRETVGSLRDRVSDVED